MTHDAPWVIGGHSNESWRWVGAWGVYLFFAISGFLICTRILTEESAGSFSLRSFYVRRLWRIQPAALAYLATVAVLIGIGVAHDQWRYWFGALLMYQNFLLRGDASSIFTVAYFTRHFWTLAIEEHFYLVLSLLLFAVRRHRLRAFVAVLVTLFTAQVVFALSPYFSSDTFRLRTYWTLPYFLIPAILALTVSSDVARGVMTRRLTPSAVMLSICCLTLIFHGGFQGLFTRLTLVHNGSWLLYAPGLLLVATVLHPESWTTRLLERRAVRYVGRLSYSLYLWHILFFCMAEPNAHVSWPPLVFLGQRPMRYVATFAAAMLSYYLIEKPFIRMGYRIAPPATAGHADLVPAQGRERLVKV